MGRKLSKREADLYRRCDEVLHYIWDPIGVADAPGARDEYRSYLPRVFEMVRDEVDPQSIQSYLTEIERTSMGLSPNPDKAAAVVGILQKWREWLWEHAA